MGQLKGNTGNPHGRPKGTPNKATTDLRQWISNFIDDNRAQIQEDWQALEPKDRIVMFEKLLKYSLPTLQAVQMDVKTELEALTDDQLDAIIQKITNGK